MNTQMKEAWEAGLACLQPSARDLEHGLELHRASLVIDAYAFSPTSPVDVERYQRAIDAGASPLERQELIESMSMTRHLTEPALRAEYELAWETAGVTCVFQNAGEETQEPTQCLRRLGHFTHACDVLRPFVTRAAFPVDIERAKQDRTHCLYFSSNAVPLPQRWQSVEEELSLLATWFDLGVRMMHVTYNRRNMLGDGCMEQANGGLSDFGRAAVREMNRVGIIVDVAHCGWRTSLESARASGKPIVASHSVCCAVNMHRRGKTDEVIRAIADTGGYMGICGLPGFLGRTGDLSAWVEHLDYALRTFGADHVAIGTDRAHTAGNIGDGQDLPRVPQRPMFHALWPSDEPMFDKRWQDRRMLLSTAWTNWPLLTVGLVQKGHGDEAIARVLGGNALRVAKAVLER